MSQPYKSSFSLLPVRLRVPIVLIGIVASVYMSLGQAIADSNGERSSGSYDTTVATVLPLVTTAASLGTLFLSGQLDNGGLAIAGLAGSLIGPSLGHIYTGEWKSPLTGVGLRLVGIGFAAYGLAGALSDEAGSSDDSRKYFIVGGIIYSGSAIYNFIDAPASAERANQQSELSFHPTPIFGPGQSLGWGGTLQASF